MTLGNATNNNLFSYTSPTINLKNTGLTTIFTTLYGLRFIPLVYTVICDTATAPNGDSLFNIGWTAAAYSDYDSNATINTTPNNFVNVTTSGEKPIFPAATVIKVNVTSGDSGTALTGRIVLTGIYIT